MTPPRKPEPTAAPDDDFALVGQALAGERRAFELLVRHHERRVFRVALAVLGNREDAEDAMQDAFVQAYRHLAQFRGESRFTTWLTRIAVNAALQKRQARKNIVSLEEAPEIEAQDIPRRYEPWQADPERLFGKQELRQLIENAIESLPAIYREALVLRDIEEMSAEEAAAALDLTIPALKSRLLRARLMLRETLAAKLALPATLRSRVVNTLVMARDAVAIRLMRAAGR